VKLSSDFQTKELEAYVTYTVDNDTLPIDFFFRDDEYGIKFIHYAKWFDTVESEFYPMLKALLDRYCDKHGIQYKEIYCARITMLVQNEDDTMFTSENGAWEPHKTFIYFATPTDGVVEIDGEVRNPLVGEACVLEGESFLVGYPLHENFFVYIEIEFA
jgi:hypothetical protein